MKLEFGELQKQAMTSNLHDFDLKKNGVPSLSMKVPKSFTLTKQTTFSHYHYIKSY